MNSLTQCWPAFIATQWSTSLCGMLESKGKEKHKHVCNLFNYLHTLLWMCGINIKQYAKCMKKKQKQISFQVINCIPFKHT